MTKTRNYKTGLKILLAFVLSGVTFAFYYPSLWYGFVFDDLPTIIEYPHIRNFDPWGLFFSVSRWISRLLNQFAYKHWKIDPFGYRIINLSIHLLTGILVFFFVSKIIENLKEKSFLKQHGLLFSTLVTGLFLLHPVQTQTVTYITQMMLEGLVVFFTFAVLLTFVYAVKASNLGTKVSLYVLSFVLTAFAAGTKEIIIALPFLVVFVDWFFLAQGDWQSFKQRLPLHGLYFVVLFGTLMSLGIGTKYAASVAGAELHNNRGNILTGSAHEPITMGTYFISQFKVLLHYISIFFYPPKLSFDYDVKLAKSIFQFNVIVPFLMLLLLLFSTIYMFIRDKSNLIVFSICWFFTSLLPRASIFPSTELICDYKTYLPSFGILFFIALIIMYVIKFISELTNIKTIARYNMGIISLVILLLGFSTSARNIVWSSELLFWKDVIEKAPKKARAYNNYATALWEGGDVHAAEDNFYKAIDCDNVYGEPHINLAAIFQARGDKEKAMGHYKRALDIGEGHPQLFHNLGLLHLTNKTYTPAEMCFKEAINLRPTYSRAYASLGRTYHLQNKFKEAIVAYENAFKHDLHDQDVYYLYAAAQHAVNNIDKAIPYFERVNKNYLNTAFLLGSCYYMKYKYANAAKNFKIAYEKDQKNIVLRYNYAQSLLNTNKYKEALALYKQCKEQSANFPYIPLHVVKCLHKTGQHKQAQKELVSIIQTAKQKEIYEAAKNLGKELNIVLT